MTIHHCGECNQMKPITDWRGRPVYVEQHDPHRAGADVLVTIAVDDGRTGAGMTLMMLTYEMADRLSRKLAVMAEAERRNRLETQKQVQP